MSFNIFVNEIGSDISQRYCYSYIVLLLSKSVYKYSVQRKSNIVW